MVGRACGKPAPRCSWVDVVSTPTPDPVDREALFLVLEEVVFDALFDWDSENESISARTVVTCEQILAALDTMLPGAIK